MCVAVPVQIVDREVGPLAMGHVAHGDALLACCLAYVPEARVGDYVVVQNGFAMDVIEESAAREALAAFDNLTNTPSR